MYHCWFSAIWYKKGKVAHEVIHIARADRRGRPDAEHITEPDEAGGQILEHEQKPAEQDKEQRIDMRHDRRSFFQEPEQEGLFDHQEYEIVNSPEYVVPARAVPEAGQEPHDEDIAQLL